MLMIVFHTEKTTADTYVLSEAKKQQGRCNSPNAPVVSPHIFIVCYIKLL